MRRETIDTMGPEPTSLPWRTEWPEGKHRHSIRPLDHLGERTTTTSWPTAPHHEPTPTPLSFIKVHQLSIKCNFVDVFGAVMADVRYVVLPLPLPRGPLPWHLSSNNAILWLQKWARIPQVTTNLWLSQLHREIRNWMSWWGLVTNKRCEQNRAFSIGLYLCWA